MHHPKLITDTNRAVCLASLMKQQTTRFGQDKSVLRGGLILAYDQTAYRPLADIAKSSPNIFLMATSNSALRFPELPDIGTLRKLFHDKAETFSRAELAKDFHQPYSPIWHSAGRYPPTWPSPRGISVQGASL